MHTDFLSGYGIDSDIRNNDLTAIHASGIKTQPSFAKSKGNRKICPGCNPLLKSGIWVNPGWNIHSYFIRRCPVHCTDKLCIFSLYRSAQSNPKDGIYYSSIFIQIQVMHPGHLIIFCCFKLSGSFSSHFLFLTRNIIPGSDSSQLKQPGNRQSVSAIVAGSADHKDFLFFFIL